jgi:hypothetical protein
VNPVEVGFFSLTSGAVGGDDDSYLEWHLLDHQPEQYSIPGIRLGTRWRADDECVALRLEASDELAPVRHAVSYLMTDPVDDTLRQFARLGRQLAEVGRMPVRAVPHLLGAYDLVQAHASPRVLVSAEAIPFRPHLGVFLLVETIRGGSADVEAWARWHHAEHVPALLGLPGVAGLLSFRSSTLLGVGAEQGVRYGMPLWDPGDRFVTVVHLDDDVAATTERLEALVRTRWRGGVVAPDLAGPFRSMVRHDAWRSAAQQR